MDLTEALKVFICYARCDKPQVLSLYERLKDVGVSPWMDVHSLVLGDQWRDVIKNAVTRADAFVVCLSPAFEEAGFRPMESPN